MALGSYFYREHPVFAQTDQTSKIQAAERAIEQAFSAVLDAEKAGGNVTTLLAKLNTAGYLLSEAQNAYNSGTAANVTINLEEARQIVNQVYVDALNLRDHSLIESKNILLMTLIFSVISVIVFSVLMLLLWRRFKHSHITKVLGMKPEVVENAA